jgi:GNAT superfamily N-acetyltransferase
MTNPALNELFTAAWGKVHSSDFQPILERGLRYVCAHQEERLVGFINVAWDGGIHALLLDTTVHPAFQRQGIGSALVRHALELARKRGCHWVHVDFEPHLEHFYASCGFRPTSAGLVKLS